MTKVKLIGKRLVLQLDLGDLIDRYATGSFVPIPDRISFY